MHHAATIFIALLLAGCSTVEVTHEFDPNTDFSALHTYDWLPPPKPTGDPRLDDNTILDARVHNAVDAALAEKGFTRAADNPDVKVGYHVTLDRQQDVEYVNSSFGYWGMYPGPYPSAWGAYPAYPGYPGYGVPAAVRVYNYLEGTLILDLFDARSKRLIWRGTARDEVNFRASPEKRQEKIDEAVRRMLAKFPPKR
jgi:hypothetical protein